MIEMSENTKGAAREIQGQETQWEQLNLDELLQQVNHCITQLENPQISLEDSFRYYEEGLRKLKMCNDKVAQIEKKMLVINSQGGLDEFYTDGGSDHNG